MKKLTITNTEAILNSLTEILLQDAIDLPPYQRDVYMYVDADGTASLEIFVNVGGNSWLNDDHITLCKLMQHYITMWDDIDSEDTLSDVTDTPWDMLIEMTVHYFDDMVDAEDLDLEDVLVMCRHTDEIVDRVAAWHDAYVRDNCLDECREMAKHYMAEYDRVIEAGSDVINQYERGGYISTDPAETTWCFDSEVI